MDFLLDVLTVLTVMSIVGVLLAVIEHALSNMDRDDAGDDI